MALTDTGLKALRPREKPYIRAEKSGLYVEVFPTSGVVWRYRYRLDGKLEKLTLGKYPALTLKNARVRRDEAAQRVAMGESPAKAKQAAETAPAADVTVADFGERFFREVVALRPLPQVVAVLISRWSNPHMTTLLDTGAIATLPGLSRTYVTDTISKRPDFPRPTVNVSQKLRRWTEADVMAWARQPRPAEGSFSAA